MLWLLVGKSVAHSFFATLFSLDDFIHKTKRNMILFCCEILLITESPLQLQQMQFLRDSIMGKEFVKYRQTRDKFDRLKFSSEVFNKSRDTQFIPVVVDTVDKELSPIFQHTDDGYMGRYKTTHSGLELVLPSTAQINDVLTQVKMKIVQAKRDDLLLQKINLCLENGDILDPVRMLSEVYKEHKYKEDRILYIIASTENTVYGYIMSILNYLYYAFSRHA